ncbi:hypothetical protein [Dinghuibacter silviterrae]|uniref:DUF4064 domain-containing protein n=1 Tax=Dinghuibacter silviterrae TaxID=1539049 RepID=A0A4R8DRY3_9BACT|nr:hypothetical protein [Dinghuibacter silviterrae]TDX00568.1 hypothetical protein EDB95_1593 [Dinghuibacter silviterrae]
MSYTPETEKPVKPSETINVLTILTFIGCAYALFQAFVGFFNAEHNYHQLVGMQQQVQDAPGVLKTLTGPGMVEIARKTWVNRVPIFLLSLLGIGLCASGAALMRTGKKRGFYFYLVGELLPTVTSLAFIGTGFLTGIFLVIGLIISLVFIALYASQLKTLR